MFHKNHIYLGFLISHCQLVTVKLCTIIHINQLKNMWQPEEGIDNQILGVKGLNLPDERAKLSIRIFQAEKDITWISVDGSRNP